METEEVWATYNDGLGIAYRKPVYERLMEYLIPLLEVDDDGRDQTSGA